MFRHWATWISPSWRLPRWTALPTSSASGRSSGRPLCPTTLYILVITTINSFQCFALIQLLTSGGPNHKTDTIMYYIYYTAFKQYKYGYGNAMGVVLAVIIAILSAVQFKLGNKDN